MQANGEPLGANRSVRPLGTAEECGPGWDALGGLAGSEQARRTVGWGEGAVWIWNLAAAYFPGAREILDCWPALERLFAIGRLAYPDNEPEGRGVVQTSGQGLLSAAWEPLEAGGWQLARTFPACAQKVEETLGSYRNNRCRRDYPRYGRMGLQIGRGAAESGCKQGGTQRLKGAGMRGKEAGAQVVRRVRCLILSQQWNEFCAFWNQSVRAAALSPLS